ncbi:MAG: DUF6175 family protein, partial [Prevotellaceae bacterium]|nr:DUF6175 family protein [Prevotellaceae bacterium]
MPTAETVVPVMPEKAVFDRIDEFTGHLDSFYKDVNQNVREIILSVKRWNNADFNLETEIDGEELTTHINRWM